MSSDRFDEINNSGAETTAAVPTARTSGCDVTLTARVRFRNGYADDPLKINHDAAILTVTRCTARNTYV